MMLMLLSSAALADNFVGQASVIDGDTLEIHGTRIRLWGVDAPESTQLCRGEDSLQYPVVRKRRMISTLTLSGAPSTVSRSTSIHMAAQWQPVRSHAGISGNGL
ncbi:thermonuclease family protein [Bradyrhizobium sp. DASA03076]|uniref:thermonuclease family protein n=1 Tax=Bradyrhizobium sp. BLXBL-03 TaxID=3395916 RepID=UPI003F72B4E5